LAVTLRFARRFHRTYTRRRVSIQPDCTTANSPATVRRIRSLAREIRGELLTIFGSVDPHTDEAGREFVKRGLDAAGIRHRISLYDAEHAFMRDVGARFDPSATDAAFTEAIELFRGL
jgi:dienelactone hydrolase